MYFKSHWKPNQHKETSACVSGMMELDNLSRDRQGICIKPLRHPWCRKKVYLLQTARISVSMCWVTFTRFASIMLCGASSFLCLHHIFKGDMCGIVSLIHHCQPPPPHPNIFPSAAISSSSSRRPGYAVSWRCRDFSTTLFILHHYNPNIFYSCTYWEKRRPLKDR